MALDRAPLTPIFLGRSEERAEAGRFPRASPARSAGVRPQPGSRAGLCSLGAAGGCHPTRAGPHVDWSGRQCRGHRGTRRLGQWPVERRRARLGVGTHCSALVTDGAMAPAAVGGVSGVGPGRRLGHRPRQRAARSAALALGGRHALGARCLRLRVVFPTRLMTVCQAIRDFCWLSAIGR